MKKTQVQPMCVIICQYYVAPVYFRTGAIFKFSGGMRELCCSHSLICQIWLSPNLDCPVGQSVRPEIRSHLWTTDGARGIQAEPLPPSNQLEEFFPRGACWVGVFLWRRPLFGVLRGFLVPGAAPTFRVCAHRRPHHDGPPVVVFDREKKAFENVNQRSWTFYYCFQH